MVATIMVGIDGSKDCCSRAVEFAVSRAKFNNARLVVAYVIEWSPYTFNTPEENEERHQNREKEIQTAHERVLDPMLKSLESEGVETVGVVRHGQVADALVKIGGEQGADHIVVGRVGHSAVSYLLFGSVAAKLIQISDVPVTIVP